MPITKDTGVTVEAGDVINDILPFCAQGVDGRDLLAQADYIADVQRTIGHQPGIARQELANKQARQVSHMSAGLAQFLARRYAAGVKDDGDLDKVEAAIVAALYAVIGPSLPGVATLLQPGLVMPDGTTIEIDANGRISVPTATAVAAGVVRPDGTTIEIDANGRISVSAPFISHRDVIQTSGAWTSNIRRVIRLTVVGAGGSGGNGGKSGLGGLGGLAGGSTTVTIPAGAMLDGELLVSSRTITAAGGSAGGGGGQLGEGGGGEAGDVSEHIVVLPAGSTINFIIGGGGVPYASGWSTTAVGTNGTGPNGGQGGVSWGGGRGAPGAGQGMCYINGYDSGSCGTISPCGYGGQKHATYGGGGPGGVGQHTNIVPRTGAKPGPGATDATIITAIDVTYPRAGNGADGAVVIEYY